MVNVYLGTSRVNWSIVIDGKLMQRGEHNVINHHLRMVKKKQPISGKYGIVHSLSYPFFMYAPISPAN